MAAIYVAHVGQFVQLPPGPRKADAAAVLLANVGKYVTNPVTPTATSTSTSTPSSSSKTSMEYFQATNPKKRWWLKRNSSGPWGGDARQSSGRNGK